MKSLDKIARFLNASVTKDELVDLINKDLTLEYSAAIQYINHSALVNDEDIASELKTHSREELEHAMLLAEHIEILGGKPAIEIGHVYTADTTKDMLGFDLQEEQGAIDRYTLRVKQAEELNLPDCAKMLSEVLAKEKEHATDIKEMLNKEK